MAKRVFVSQPMKGLTEKEILEVREQCLDYAREKLGEDVLEIPKLNKAKLNGIHPARCLGMSIELLSDADLVIFAKGWQYARGCRIEHRVCLDYQIEYEEVDI